jgi:integrase
LGPYPQVSLEEARERADAARKLRRNNIDPIEHKDQLRAEKAAAIKKAKPVPTFEHVAHRYWENKKADREDWTEFEAQLMHGFQLHVFPVPVGDMTFGKLPIDKVDTAAIKAFMESMWKCRKDGGRAQTADNLLGKIRAVIGFADFHELRGVQKNPAQWTDHLDKGFAKLSDIAPTKHHEALAPSDAYRFVAELRKIDSSTALALEALILTTVRTGCILKADWSQFDFVKGEWAIPAGVMKTRNPHWVPIDQRLFDILVKLNPLAGKQPLTGPVFPVGQHGMRQLCERIAMEVTGKRAVPHGFRATFKSWGRDHGQPRELIEATLAHVLGGKVEEGYDRPETHKNMLQRRRKLMAEWTEFLSQPVEEKQTVVPFRFAS